MKRIFTLIAFVVAVLVSSCAYDDTSIWSAITDLQNRMKAVEELCKQTNTNLGALQKLVDALSENEQIKSIAPIEKDGNIIGYTLTFTDGESVTLYNKNNEENVAVVPQIGVSQDSDGIYYWTLDGEWLLDANGNKIKAQGEDALTPKFKIEDEYWYVSYDNGVTWNNVGKVVPGGSVDCDCQSIITDVEYDDEYVYITLADGNVLVLPRASMDNNISLNRVKLTLPPNNEVWYTFTTGEIIELDNYPYELVENTYIDGIGRYKFSEDVVNIGNYFSTGGNPRELIKQFTSLIFPSTVTNLDTYNGLADLLNVNSLVFSENLESVGIDFMGGFGSYLDEKHIYFLSEKSPNTSICTFWNNSPKLYVHYPVGADYSNIEAELIDWQETSTPFRYEMVETVYEITYADKDIFVEPEAIDLGLSVMWASYNVGANRPEEYGDYYAWGEINTKNEYSGNNFAGASISDIAGNPEYDAATANWGDGWRMPSRDELIELVNNCIWEWTSINSVNGMCVTGPNGNSIFLPAAGHMIDQALVYFNSYGFYWSATEYGYWSAEHCLYFCYDGSVDQVQQHHSQGFSIRPVMNK